jgi:hypothetical protein
LLKPLVAGGAVQRGGRGQPEPRPESPSQQDAESDIVLLELAFHPALHPIDFYDIIFANPSRKFINN